MRVAIILFALVVSASAQTVEPARLHSRIAAACPIAGVSVGDPADKATWRIDVAPGATTEQRAAAASIVATWTAADWEIPKSEKRATKYVRRVDQWTHAIVRYQARLLDARLTEQQRAKIQTKLDAAVRKVQDESTAIETEDPD